MPPTTSPNKARTPEESAAITAEIRARFAAWLEEDPDAATAWWIGEVKSLQATFERRAAVRAVEGRQPSAVTQAQLATLRDAMATVMAAMAGDGDQVAEERRAKLDRIAG